MKKRISLLSLSLLFVFIMAGCWNGEVFVDTTFEMDGSGERIFQLTVLDDTLSTETILNPDDPDGVSDKGPVINNKHIVDGIPAIQTWLEENAPDFITVHDMETDGIKRIFTLSFTWDDFDEFLDKMQQLVDASPVLSWDDFDADELPSFEVSGTINQTATFTESRVIVDAALDWAIDGIFNDIYDADDLAGFVDKGDIAILADYRVTLNGEVVEERMHYDPDLEDPNDDLNTGLVVYPSEDAYTVSSEATNMGLVSGIIALGVVIIGGTVGFIVFKKK